MFYFLICHKVTIDENPYKLYKTEVDGVNYYCLLPAGMADAGEIDSQSHNSDFIYLDRMPVAPKILEGKYVERHRVDIDGEYLVDVLHKGYDGRWQVWNNSHYSNAKDRPIVKIVNDEVKFIKPATTKNSTKAVKRSTTGTNKKRTPPKKQKR